MEWNKRIQVQKGDFAENLIKDHLERKGYVLYATKTNKAHCFDMIAMKDKTKMMIVEIKAKPKLLKYEETGIETKHYNEYKYISQKYNLPLFIFFVDENLGEIYGNFLEKLEQNMRKSPWDNGNQTLFHMDTMVRNIEKLKEEEIEVLKNKSSMSYDYVVDANITYTEGA